MVDTCSDRLVLEVDRGYARGYGFTLLQRVLNTESGEYNNVPIDLTGLTVLFQVKLSPYVEVKPLIAKEITEASDEVAVGYINNPTQGQFQVQITNEESLLLKPRDYSLCIYLKDQDTFTNISRNGNYYAIFRVLK